MKQFLVLSVVLVAAAMAQTEPGRVERQFQNNGNIKMELDAGDYEVRAGSSDKIVISYHTRTSDQLKQVDAQISGSGSYAKIKVSGPHNDFHATIEVPSHTGLVIRLSAGDLRVRGIEGDKDVEAHAGDVNIEVGRAEQYGPVDASVKAGDLNAPVFHQSQGGLFRSFHWNGPGKYRLNAHLGAGDLNLN
jgi:hypothetical protein